MDLYKLLIDSIDNNNNNNMVYKDRTSEFNSISETLRKKQEQNGVISKKQNAHQQMSQFSLAAAHISRGVYETSEKLHKLTKLAKKSSIFNDPSADIEELTFIIKQDIQKLNQEISQLGQISKQSRSNKQTEEHSETVVGFLNLKLISATKEFKDILEVRTENLKTQQERKQKFSYAYGQTQQTTPLLQDDSGSTSIPPKSSEMLRHRNTTTNRDDDSALYRYQDDQQGNDLAISMPMQVQAHDYSQSRLRTAETISSTIHQLESIFHQLANLVQQQGEVIERIDTNIDDSLMNVGRGHDSLLKTLADISSNRGLIFRIFLVLIVFIVIFVVFFV
ncbi:t-SNARE family protein [Heterostelium album PN500]|uniref:t-SNARE family protein n=1 Tax=Heterostelium pallidum (strain ATCC 26659 / Pp 5 / PN500) TaxID=670386 RepID=D3BCB9_HETP5|nr:t-SNARE family protein [Heterostelium album PN500]EFA80909.1 t-SNARE family protein [Heterostelium album PN500]|eukprot:XP_020433027.1 t-SNARE family protein [Heterostelium album PN500]